MTLPDPRQDLIDAARTAEVRGLTSGTAGNFSVRFKDGMLITPTGIPPSRMHPDQIVPMALDGTWEGAWRPSSEWAIHARLYQQGGAGAVVHAHPDHCVALSCLRKALPPFHYMIAGFGGDDVPCAAYAPFGSPELADAVADAMQGRSACLMANHGMVTTGRDLDDALARAEKLEMLARQFLLASGIGDPVLLTGAEMAEVHRRYAGYGQQRS